MLIIRANNVIQALSFSFWTDKCSTLYPSELQGHRRQL